MLKSSLCDYSDAYILVTGTITITGAEADDPAKRADERNRGVIFENCVSFTNSINEINNTQIDNAKDIDVVMLMYSLIKFSNNYSKTSRNLWQYHRDGPNTILTESKSFKFKARITESTSDDDNKKKKCWNSSSIKTFM